VRYRIRVIYLYVVLLMWLGVPAVTAPNARLQRAVDISMKERQGAAVALNVESGQVVASYRMDVAARRVASPGSAVKPFTLMALLEGGVVREQTAIVCPRIVRIGTYTLDCSHPETNLPLDPVTALAYSCNHFFTSMSRRLPMDALRSAFVRAGFNSVTGKWATEIPGLVAEPRSSDELELMGVGEAEIQVTPLALAEAYRNLIRPLRQPADVTPELRLVSRGMQAVVEKGTGQLAASNHVQVAGKTGTSEGHAWFAGFAPADNPEVVIVIFLEHGTGGADAAPLAGRIFDDYFSNSDGGS
jgi:cell division protein FtsI/penicillin-binding protein 2